MDFDLFFYDDMRAAFERGTIETDHGLEWGNPSATGYGVCRWTTEGFHLQVGAHRVSWMLENGKIPSGHEIDHHPECPKNCVTPSHLQALSPSDHARLGWERGELNGGWGTKRERIHPPKPEAFEWQTDRVCKNNCGTVFTPNTSQQLHCSPECGIEYKESLRNLRRNPRPTTKICEETSCEIEFIPKRKDSNFCSRACISKNNYKNRAVVQTKRPCAECVTTFLPLRSNGKFCSQRCGEKFRGRRKSS